MTCRLCDVWNWKPDVEFQYGGRLGELNGMSSQSHVSHCRVLPLDKFTVTIPEPYATLQDVRIPYTILKIVFRRILFYFCFQCSLGFDERRLSYCIRYTCFCIANNKVLALESMANKTEYAMHVCN